MEKRWLSAKELGEYLGISVKTARKLGESWGAQKKLGYRTVRYDGWIIDKAISKEATNEGRNT